jgi:hypothetical protein
MDNEQIDRFDLISQYLMGKLQADETARFEEHFIDCPQCIVQLQTMKDFISDLRFAAAEQIVAAESVSPIDHHRLNRSWGSYLQMLLRRPLALAFSCLLIAVVIGAVLMVVYTRRLRTEMYQSKSLYEQLERRYDDERQSAISVDQRHQETELQQAEQLQALEAKLKDEEAQRTKMAAEINRHMRPTGNLPIFVLTSVRGQTQGGSETVKEIPLSGSSAMFVLSIQIVEETQFDRYRITIFDDHHRRIWQSGKLMLGPNSELSTPFNSNFFRPGTYSLIVEGVNKAGGTETVGKYPFLITKTP